MNRKATNANRRNAERPIIHGSSVPFFYAASSGAFQPYFNVVGNQRKATVTKSNFSTPVRFAANMTNYEQIGLKTFSTLRKCNLSAPSLPFLPSVDPSQDFVILRNISQDFVTLEAGAPPPPKRRGFDATKIPTTTSIDQKAHFLRDFSIFILTGLCSAGRVGFICAGHR